MDTFPPRLLNVDAKWLLLLSFLSLFVIGIWSHRIGRVAGRARGFRIASGAKFMAGIGIVSSLLTCTLVPIAQWPYATVGLVLGISVGLIYGWSTIKGWEMELARGGPLTGHWSVRPAGATQSLLAGLLVVGLAFVLFSVARVCYTCVVSLMLCLSGGIAVSGASTWLWARRKEKHGHSELVIPTI